MNQMKTRPDWSLTTAEVAKLLGCSRSQAIRLIDRGEIPSWRTGRHRRVSRTDVESYRASKGIKNASGGMLLCSGGDLARWMAQYTSPLRHAGCIGQAGQMYTQARPDWVVLDLSHCARAEALGWSWHLKKSEQRARVMLLLEEGQQLTVDDYADCVIGWPHDPEVIAKEVNR